MGSMLRSDPMTLCEMIVQTQSAYEVFARLGNMDCVHFLNMNLGATLYQRGFAREFCTCVDMEKILQYLETEMAKEQIYVPELKKDPPPMNPSEMKLFETVLTKLESDMVDITNNLTSIIKSYFDLKEMYYVLRTIGPMIGDNKTTDDLMKMGKGLQTDPAGRIYFAAGIVMKNRSKAFETMIFRISRGIILFRNANDDIVLADPYNGTEVRKVAFYALCQGDELYGRLQKVFSGFQAHIYPCPMSEEERMTLEQQTFNRIDDMEHVIKKTKYHRCRALFNIGKKYREWKVQVTKAKAIYVNLNLCSMHIIKKTLIGECWIPNKDLAKVQQVLDEVEDEISAVVPSVITPKKTFSIPPTYHRTNKFTSGFQGLINAYGDSTYGELNPALYGIITFPFLFAIMFGDVCHGLLGFIFAFWMVKNEKKFTEVRSDSEIWNIFFEGRYVILMMSVFSFYTGLMYNEWFSLGIATMRSDWTVKDPEDMKKVLELHLHYQLDPRKHLAEKPVYFHMDPVWKLASNKINVENSLKMKFSIIIGVIHMMFGIVLSLVNHIHFKRYHAIWLEFIPKIVFLTCLFFWLLLLIILKWFIYSGVTANLKLSAGCAPQILILFIDMVLMKKTEHKEEDCDPYIFSSQRTVQTTLLALSGLCVPVLLFGAPTYRYREYQKLKLRAQKRFKAYSKKIVITKESQQKEYETLEAKMISMNSTYPEMMINQGVETIEFVLSTVSHTASYLRLWALSLAHAQLSEMLWQMILSKLALKTYDITGSIRLFAIFAVWAAFSLSILVLMEGMSAFLHTLRLHWVEFMSKFYSGGGYKFKPFSFRDILERSTEDKSAPCSFKT